MTLARSLAAALSWGCLFAVPAAANATRVPTQLVGNAALQVRPHQISFTGDGTGFLGGFTGRGAVKTPSRERLGWAGRLHWIIWNRNEGRAIGADWINNGIPDDAEGTFHPYAATVRVYRPRGGVFTRMTVTESVRGEPPTFTLKAARFNGFWQWG